MLALALLHTGFTSKKQLDCLSRGRLRCSGKYHDRSDAYRLRSAGIDVYHRRRYDSRMHVMVLWREPTDQMPHDEETRLVSRTRRRPPTKGRAKAASNPRFYGGQDPQTPQVSLRPRRCEEWNSTIMARNGSVGKHHLKTADARPQLCMCSRLSCDFARATSLNTRG